MCDASFEQSLELLERNVTEVTARLRNLEIIAGEMNGESKGLFMDHEREGVGSLIAEAKGELAGLRADLDAKIEYYNTEVKGMEQVVQGRYALMSRYNDLLTKTPACAQLLAHGQLELEQELRKRKGVCGCGEK